MKKAICCVAFTAFIVFSSFLSCVEKESYDVKVVNKSVDTIYVYVQVGAQIKEPYFENLRSYSLHYILPDSSYTQKVYVEEDFFLDHISVIVFKKKTIENYSIDEIRQKKIMDWGLVYSFEELDRMGHCIEYTGEAK